MRAVFTRDVELEHGPSPYLDERNARSARLRRSRLRGPQEQRYGAVRDMRGVQDEINQRRSKALHYLNVRQIQEISPGAAMVDAEGHARKPPAPMA
jgi:hypothetical protein